MTARANVRNMRSLLRKVERGDKLNIFTFATHERYEENLCRTGHNFYSYRYGKEWDTTYAPIPDNYFIIDKIPQNVDFDLILSHTNCNRLQVARDLLSDTTGYTDKLPIPVLRHCHVLPDVRYDVTDQIMTYHNIEVDKNSFISEYNAVQWGFNQSNCSVVRHGVDSDFWAGGWGPDNKSRELYCLSVVNEFPTRDWCCGYNLWQEIQNSMPCCVVGKCTGKYENFSQPAQSREHLRDYYQTAAVFLNTSLHSPVPTVMLEAMACGCPVVSTENCMIPEIIEHGVNGFMSNDPEELKRYCQKLLEDPDLARKMGEAARKTIEKSFNLERFVSDWNNLLYNTIGEYNACLSK